VPLVLVERLDLFQPELLAVDAHAHEARFSRVLEDVRVLALAVIMIGRGS
jgi:hypothetical protein